MADQNKINEMLAKQPLHYLPIDPTPEQREKIRQSPLNKMGDCILIAVNEGDFVMKNPVNVAELPEP